MNLKTIKKTFQLDQVIFQAHHLINLGFEYVSAYSAIKLAINGREMYRLSSTQIQYEDVLPSRFVSPLEGDCQRCNTFVRLLLPVLIKEILVASLLLYQRPLVMMICVVPKLNAIPLSN